MWDGTSKRAKNIIIDDVLVDDLGNPTTVRTTCSGLKNMYASYQNNVSESRTTLGQSMAAVDVLENELNQSKIRLNLIEDQMSNKLRLVEINTYYSKQYNSYSKLMKTIVFFWGVMTQFLMILSPKTIR